jgi:hypothetical protein
MPVFETIARDLSGELAGRASELAVFFSHLSEPANARLAITALIDDDPKMFAKVVAALSVMQKPVLPEPDRCIWVREMIEMLLSRPVQMTGWAFKLNPTLEERRQVRMAFFECFSRGIQVTTYTTPSGRVVVTGDAVAIFQGYACLEQITWTEPSSFIKVPGTPSRVCF